MSESPDTTILLNDLAEGDREAAERLLPLVYSELHGLAEGYFRRQSPNHTLQPTALVNEAFIRMIDRASVDYRGRQHFMAVAATAMQQILIDHARRKKALKHGGDRHRVTLIDADGAGDANDVDLLALEEALRRLAELDVRKSQVVTMRFLGGLSMEETADMLGIARSTVAEDWRFARAWLIRELRGADDQPPE